MRRRLISPMLMLSVVTHQACKNNGGNGDDEGQADGSSESSSTGVETTDDVDTGDPSTDGDSTTADGSATDGGASTDTDASTSLETGVDTSSETASDGSSESTGGDDPCPYTPVDGTPSLAVELVATGFDRPLLVRSDPADSDRLFVLEQGGNIRILAAGETTAPTDAFLTVDPENANNDTIGSETGLLGFAFHPDFPTDPRVYVHYNPDEGMRRTVIEEFSLDDMDPNVVDATTARSVIEIDNSQASNHKGGMIAFGPDGYLYIAMGDGGGSNDDAAFSSRDTDVLLSKMLRIGVDPDGMPDMTKACDTCDELGPFDYTIPSDNPFIGDAGFRPETWAWGLRNPYRFDFDSETGVLYLGDVGQGSTEEIDIIEMGNDYGWIDMEGNHCHGDSGCDESAGPNEQNMDGLTAPVAEYSSEDGSGNAAVVGGSVYRSCEVPAWDGWYFYADYASGRIWALSWDGANVMELGEQLDLNDGAGEERRFITGFGTNGHGDVYFTVTVASGATQEISDGHIYRLAPG